MSRLLDVIGWAGGTEGTLGWAGGRGGGERAPRGQAEVDTGGGRGPGGSRWFLGITNGHTRMVVRTHMYEQCSLILNMERQINVEVNNFLNCKLCIHNIMREVQCQRRGSMTKSNVNDKAQR